MARDEIMYNNNTLEMQAWVTVEGLADPLSGSTLRFAVKRNEDDPEESAIVTKYTGGGGINGILQGTTAYYTWTIDGPDDLTELGGGDFGRWMHWGVNYTSNDGRTKTIGEGRVKVLRAVVQTVP